MLKSSKTNLFGVGKDYSNNSDYNGSKTSFLQPQLTSTPMPIQKKESIFATPPKASKVWGPRRYLLSEIATPPRTNRKTNLNHSGPLLASLPFNESVSVYEECKSPGLASRIIQYSEDSEHRRRTPTHQTKYNSPGLFPVVHLFKTDLPTFEQKPKKVTVQIGHHDKVKQHSSEYNRKLLEEVVKPSLRNQCMLSRSKSVEDITNVHTRSVLDALKEISRKRIHANEDSDAGDENGKRICMENVQSNTNSNNKRTLDDDSSSSSKGEESLSPSSKPIPKRACVCDEYTASKSSSEVLTDRKSILHTGTKRKTSSTSTLTEDHLQHTKQVKLINAETQTVVDESSVSTATESPSSVVIEVTSSIADDSSNKKLPRDSPPVKIFDEVSLESRRRNRLATLMGQLVGKAATSAAPENDNSIVEAAEIEKPQPRIEKHVHFNIPASITQTSASIVTPIMSSAVSTKTVEAPAAPPSSPVEQVVLPVVKFELPSITAVPVTSATPIATTTTLPAPVVPVVASTKSFSFDAVKPSPNEASKKVGGFTFDLKKPTVVSTAISSTTVPPTAVPTFSFGSSTTTNKPKDPALTTPTFGFGTPVVTSTVSMSLVSPPKVSSTSTASSSFGFGSNLVTNNKNAPTFPSTTSTPHLGQPSFASTAPPMFGNVTSASNVFGASTNSFGTATTVTTTGSNIFGNSSNKFGSTVTTAAAAAPSNMFGASTNNSFGTTTVTTASLGFGTSNAFGMGTAAVKTSATSGFGASTNTFGSTAVTTSASNAFGAPANSFGIGTTAVTASISNTFGTPTNNFGIGTTAVTTAASNAFGSSTNTFGGVGTTTSATMITKPLFSFSSNNKDSNNITFGGSTQAFGVATTNQPTFPINSTTNAFSASNAVVAPFGSNTASVFGSTGADKKPFPFSASTAAVVPFGASNNAVAAPPPQYNNNAGFNFNIPAKPSFSFGGNTASTSISSTAEPAKASFNFTVGQSTTNLFGNTNAATPAFGGTSNSAPIFGNPSSTGAGFGSSSHVNSTSATFGVGNSTPSVFGGGSIAPSAAPVFGGTNSTTAPVFGGTATVTPTFSGFGANASPSPAFAAPQFNAVGSPGQGMFNIGSGSSSSSRHRTQLKAKRRT